MPMESGPNYLYVCNYMLDTGIKRGISVKECYKKEVTPYEQKERFNHGRRK